jgi:hypothetical protein
MLHADQSPAGKIAEVEGRVREGEISVADGLRLLGATEAGKARWPTPAQLAAYWSHSGRDRGTIVPVRDGWRAESGGWAFDAGAVRLDVYENHGRAWWDVVSRLNSVALGDCSGPFPVPRAMVEAENAAGIQ